MRECDIGWPSSDEDAASLDAHGDDLSTIKKHDNKLTRHPATSLLVQHAAIMAAFVEWWHVRLRARLVYGLPALSRRSAPLPLCLMAIVGSYCGWSRCCECLRLGVYTCEGCQSCFCGQCWYWCHGPRPRSMMRCWRCWKSPRPFACSMGSVEHDNKLTRKLELRALRPKPPKPAGCAMEKLREANKQRLRALRRKPTKPTACAMELHQLRHSCAEPLPRCSCEEWAHLGWRCFCYF